MTSPRDPVDDWLGAGVTPLSPPPGSLARIRERARRRKTRQATFVAVGCAVVLAAGATTPQVISALQHPGHPSPPVAIGSSTPSLSTSASPSTAASASPEGKATQLRQRTHLSVTKSGTLPPANFRPTSVTFVGDGSGGVVGAVIGQAGPPCATSVCTSLAGTSSYGKTWYGVSAPVAPGPSGSSGVSQLRFANLHDGWAYGPALYETSGGGWPWHHESTFGQRVIDVEAAPERAFAVFGMCDSPGADYAASCTSFSLWTSVPGTRTWTQVSVPAADQAMQSTSSAAPVLVISGGGAGYLLTPSGEILTGPATKAGGPWRAAGQAPCKPGPRSASGTAAQASATQSPAAQSSATQAPGDQSSAAPAGLLAAGKELLLTCASQAAGGSEQVALYTGSDGATWRRAGSVTVTGTPTSLTSAASGQVVMATAAGIEYSANAGKSWRASRFAGGAGAPAGGFSYVGMTNQNQGVAVPARPNLHEIFTTVDGGRTWQPSPITG